MSFFKAPISFPNTDWEVIAPEDAGFSASMLDSANDWIRSRVDEYRFLVIHSGRIVFEACQGMEPGARVAIASAAKSIYSSVLGIEQEMHADFSADDVAVRYFPEMMKVPEGRGPKPGRYAFEKDADITLRQLISNTSGYMKPGELPGRVFNYQTYGMNILTHALAARHGLYDSTEPTASDGFGSLIDSYIGEKIGCNWTYSYTNFDLHSEALLGIFGYYCQVRTTVQDFARIALLWNSGGAWNGRSVIPESWLRQAVSVSSDLRRHGSKEDWKYGMGFWSNEFGILWPKLPRDGFAACGAGGHYACCFPSRDIIVIQNPGPFHQQPEDRANPQLLEMVLDACS